MKYYFYISDAKVDMLLQQIPHKEKRKLATEFKVDLKILGATWKKETGDEQDRMKRLEAVCEFINTFGNVGSVDEPSEYIADTLLMNWNTYTYNGERADIVYFGGLTDKSVVGLAGSTHHLIGGPTKPHDVNIHDYIPSSSPPAIFRWLRELRGAANALGEGKQQYARRENYWLSSTFYHTHCMEGPKQNLEFLAKRLFEGDYNHKSEQSLFPASSLKGGKLWHIVIGTPLYIAMAD